MLPWPEQLHQFLSIVFQLLFMMLLLLPLLLLVIESATSLFGTIVGDGSIDDFNFVGRGVEGGLERVMLLLLLLVLS